MRSVLRIAALSLVLLALLVPMAAYGSDGPCPDDPVLSASCNQTAPPYYVVINRDVEYLYPDRPGTGCQPIILSHPECQDCGAAECAAAEGDVDAVVCPSLPPPPTGEVHVVYEMCCACAVNPAGDWVFRIRLLDDTGACPVDPNNPNWIQGLPPGTGIDLPMPVIVGGLALLGAGLLAAGVVVRRRTVQAA